MTDDPTPQSNWFPVSLSSGLALGGVMRVQSGDHDLAVWRAQDGTVHCVDNRCPHRGMRLSFGFVRGNRLNCIYHGWQYGTTGACQYIPAHPELEPPPSLCVQTHHCDEHTGLIWVSFNPKATRQNSLENLFPVRSIAVDVGAQHVFEFLSRTSLPDLVHEGLSIPANTATAATDRAVIDFGSNRKIAAVVIFIQSVHLEKSILHTQLSEQLPAEMLVSVSRWLEALRRSIERTP